MSPWQPQPNNMRNNKKVGYVLAKKNNRVNNNIIRLYTRVVLTSNGWKPDPAYGHGNFYKTRNGKNFNKVTKLYGGYFPIQTTLRWSTLKNNLKRYTR
jgi:hypothetical protein